MNAIKAQTSGLIHFEYAASGLRERSANAADHQSVVSFLKLRRIESYTYDLKPKID